MSGEVVVLVVQDTSQQGKNPVLVQPVRKDWLTMDEAHLNDQYIAFQGMPEELMYRTAIIARTGVPPAQPATA